MDKIYAKYDHYLSDSSFVYKSCQRNYILPVHFCYELDPVVNWIQL